MKARQSIQSNIWLKRLLLAVGLLVLIAYGSRWLLGRPLWRSDQAQVRALEPMLMMLAGYEVRSLRNTATCHSLEYGEGTFSDNAAVSTCWYSATPPEEFDEESWYTFQRITQELRSSGLRVADAFVSYEPTAAIKQASFALRCPICLNRIEYVYEPAYRLPEDIPGEMWFKPIDQNWYRMEIDGF